MNRANPVSGILLVFCINQGISASFSFTFLSLTQDHQVPVHLRTSTVPDIVKEIGIKTIPKKKKCKNTKWLSKEALQIAKKRREEKGKGEKERYTHLNAEFQRTVRRDKKAFLSDQLKKQRKTIEWERLEISSRKLEIPREHFMQRWAQ